MSVELVLRGHDLTPERVAGALATISAAGPIRCRLDPDRDRAPRIQFWLELRPDDPACAVILIAWGADGATLAGATANRGAALLDWCFRQLASRLECALDDPRDGEPESDEEIEAIALEVLRKHEKATRDDRDYHGQGGEAVAEPSFIDWLVARDKLALAGDSRLLAPLEDLLDRPDALYDALMESELVDEVFLDPDELRAAIAEFSAGR